MEWHLQVHKYLDSDIKLYFCQYTQPKCNYNKAVEVQWR